MGGGRGNGVCGIWSHRSSFSFLISWALSLQTAETGREAGDEGVGEGTSASLESPAASSPLTACKQGPLQPAAHPPHPRLQLPPAAAAANFIRPQLWPGR